MRNKYPGYCYRCGTFVEKGQGHFERKNGYWRLQHADCAINYRGTKVQGNGTRPTKGRNSN
ncbi:hypothetical protein p113_131 [Enterococcus phage 113]|uniref:Uncharacterized protein n=1 Tax=Enterococcus phage 113 TaxID=2835638 RepID=A0A8E7FYA3_9CAUD|nr:hypothetical protein p113_131 [Enterococcus phage 113]